MDGRQVWPTPERMLESYLDMMDQGKVVASDDSYNSEQERLEPWKVCRRTQLLT